MGGTRGGGDLSAPANGDAKPVQPPPPQPVSDGEQETAELVCIECMAEDSKVRMSAGLRTSAEAAETSV